MSDTPQSLPNPSPSAAVTATAPPATSSDVAADSSSSAADRDARLPAAGVPLAVPGYEILEELGRGGMGVVYKARHLKLQRVVALKMIRSGDYASPAELARFLTEAEAVAHLQHPNIVQIFETGQHAGLPYFTLEFVEGGSLATKIGAQPLPAGVAARLVEDLARGMHHAHGKGLLHRDLKPANVLLTADGTPKIADFGLAKKLEADSGLTQTGAIMGTPSYMAPEQAEGRTRDIGPRTDVCALGAILYECLTGRPPFRGSTTLETLEQVRLAEPVPVRQLQPRVPRDLETICLKCLEKAPPRRYATALDLAEDLRRFRMHEPIRARRASLPERVAKWSRRRPAAAALIAVCLLAALGTAAAGTAYTLELRGRAEYERDQKVLAQELQKKAEEGETAARAATALAEQETRRANEAAARERQASLNAIRALYGLRVNRAGRALEDGDHGTAVEELGRMHPANNDGHDLRGFEWYYWDRLLNAHAGTIRPPLQADVSAAAYSPGGRLLAYTQASILTFASPRSGRTWRTTTCLPNMRDMAFSPDGRFLAAAGEAPGVLLYDFGLPESERAFREDAAIPPPPVVRLPAQNQAVRGLAFSPDGTLLAAAGSDGRVVLWNPVERKSVKVLYGPAKGFLGVAFRPDGRRLAVAHSNGTVHVWALPGYEREPLLTRPGFPASMPRLAYAPEGNLLVAADWHGNLHVWAADSGAYQRTVAAHKQDIRALSFSADGTQFVTAGEDRTVRLWDAYFMTERARFIGHDAAVTAAAFRPDGRQIISGDRAGVLKFWDPAKNPAVTEMPRPVSGVEGVAFSPDGRHVAAAIRTGGLEVWNVAEHRCAVEVKALAPELHAVAWQPGGTTVAVAGGDGKVRLRDGRDGKEVRTLEGHQGPVRALAFRPDGKVLASGGDDGPIQLWDVETGKTLRVLPGHPRTPTAVGTVRGLAFHPDGRRLVSVGYDSMLRFWDVEKGVETAAHTVSGLSLECVALDRTGELVAYGSYADSVLRLGPCRDGFRENRVTFLAAHQKPLVAVAFTPDGKRLVSASLDSTVRLWNTDTLQEMLTLGGFRNGVRALAVSADGHFLAAGGTGGELLVWDASPRPPAP
jgi:WD40 repeat protein/tRNA A-37 threonylcarbamoyl transferase component Bud32